MHWPTSVGNACILITGSSSVTLGEHKEQIII